MFKVGSYFKMVIFMVIFFEEGKFYFLIIDWIEVFFLDRYEEFSLDGILEFVDSVNIFGF